MALMTVAFLLPTLARLGAAARTRASSNVSSVCPEKVEMNSRKDCVDGDTGAIVASECCEQLQWCHREIRCASGELASKIEVYHFGCGLQEDDVSDSGGTFRVVNASHICSPKCQDNAELKASMVPGASKCSGYEELAPKCSSHEQLPILKAQDDLVRAMDKAWSSCEEDSFDFTEYLEALGSPPRFLELGDSRTPEARYKCCCGGPGQCELVHQKNLQGGLFHRIGVHRAAYAACGKRGGLRPWNAAPGGRCVVSKKDLPDAFLLTSDVYIRARLREALQVAGVRSA